jgi:hypothetical protein
MINCRTLEALIPNISAVCSIVKARGPLGLAS